MFKPKTAPNMTAKEMVERGRAIAARSVNQDLQEMNADVIALDGVQDEYRRRLKEIKREKERLDEEEKDTKRKFEINATRLRSLETSIYNLKTELVGQV